MARLACEVKGAGDRDIARSQPIYRAVDDPARQPSTVVPVGIVMVVKLYMLFVLAVKVAGSKYTRPALAGNDRAPSARSTRC